MISLKKPSLNELVSHVDILPTLAAMTGLPYTPDASLDGTNVTGILNGEIASLDRMLVVDTQRKQWPEKGRNSCVMTTQWRLVNGSELYNTPRRSQGKKMIWPESSRTRSVK